MKWLVIWLAGQAVMVMDAGTPDNCQSTMLPLVTADIEASVITDDEGNQFVIGETGETLPWGEWEVTCEATAPKIGDTRDD